MPELRRPGNGPPNYGAHPNIFTVTIHHGGNWFTLSGNNKYEGGEVGHFDWVHFNYFTKKELDGMVIDLRYKLPVGFLYKPIGKTLNMGFMVVVDKDIKMIIEDIESNRATEIHVVHALGWKEDSEVVNHVPSKALPPLKGCVIEELPNDCDVPVDVFGIPIINIEEDHEEREVIMLCDSNHGTADVGMEEANEVRNHTFEENLGEAEEVRRNKKGKRKVVEEDFILEEEEFIQDVEAEKEMGTKADPKRWWGSIVMETLMVIISENDLRELNSDDEDGICKSSIEFNPKTNIKNFNFELHMEFATVTLLKDTIREYFIVNDMEFVFIANESNRVRVKCKAPGCKWMLFASLINKIEGKTMKQLVTRKRGRPPLKNPSEETIKRKARRNNLINHQLDPLILEEIS
ncbi:hypothetical protein G4B88_000715 [Cannabis sativa]|uniref:Transposase MuDR plant domain-containing protein n=1 Tax=Cannabis sativa TaxID=3483 RepID=A0A7J6ET81_CANSA|nr:hypothetical protein G4B88_000715 [Cannabis sativa]